ncbi:hypothetical protein NITHO_680003 [Nitrolancea hollandica Lb]|uniref:Uncharacterized protein n=1 Tax=Nitrolancea hollandica Lb TaxID=1129897 RepID=I4EMX6_9BACT|nr:hypothetical protein NITHO_680003 [Nitrolancea hollandica Lb]
MSGIYIPCRVSLPAGQLFYEVAQLHSSQSDITNPLLTRYPGHNKEDAVQGYMKLYPHL